MPKTLIFTPKAEQDLDDAYQWYEKQDAGLGEEYIKCVETKIGSILLNPLHFEVVFKTNVRRALVNRFPFSIYFVNEEEAIIIFAILNQRRNPDFWKSRV